MRTEYLIRVGNPDPDFSDEARNLSESFRFASRDVATAFLVAYFDNWAMTDMCDACSAQASKVRDYLEACLANQTPVDWEQVEVEGDNYWVVPVSVAGPAQVSTRMASDVALCGCYIGPGSSGHSC